MNGYCSAEQGRGTHHLGSYTHNAPKKTTSKHGGGWATSPARGPAPGKPSDSQESSGDPGVSGGTSSGVHTKKVSDKASPSQEQSTQGWVQVQGGTTMSPDAPAQGFNISGLAQAVGQQIHDLFPVFFRKPLGQPIHLSQRVCSREDRGIRRSLCD